MGVSTEEIIEMAVCFALLGLYYTIFLVLSFKKPYLTTLGINIIEQQRFASRYLAPKPGQNNILAIQALRNYMWSGQLSCLVAVPIVGVAEDEENHYDSHHIIKFSPKEEKKTFVRVRKSGCKMMLGVSVTFSIGMRAFFCAFPVGLWIVGTPGLWVGTFLLLFFHIITDYVWGDPAEE